jgi:hypothetical protein
VRWPWVSGAEEFDDMSTAQTAEPVYVLLADGSTVEIRPAGQLT